MILTARKSDLELQMQFVTQARMSLANVAAALRAQPQTAAVTAQLATIEASDRQLELQMQRIQTQLQAVQTEIDAVRKVIGKNIESTFKTFG